MKKFRIYLSIFLMISAVGIFYAVAVTSPPPKTLITKARRALLGKSGSNIFEVRKARLPGIKKSLKEKGFALGQPIFIRVFKQEAKLELWLKPGEKFKLYKTFDICDFSGSLGPKLKEGDMQSPEGFYSVTKGLMNPNSTYHLSFNIGFPNKYDRSHGRTGSYLMIHGDCVSIGCYAMTDKGIEEIYLLAENTLKGLKNFQVHIFPFRMTKENLEKNKDNKWHSFWLNLKEGYDIFEQSHNPPSVTVRNKTYIFNSNKSI